MSKKMLKRSLALSALMAFVITGSAMAAEDKIAQGVKTELQSGSYDKVVGGVYLKLDTTEDNSVELESTNVIINGDNAVEVLGGSRFNQVADVKSKIGVTNVTIVDGSFGEDPSGTDNVPAGLVVGGDNLKTNDANNHNNGVNATGFKVESNIDTTNLKIKGGNFNSLILGGSSVIKFYGDGDSAEEYLKAKVGTANTEITGGTFTKHIIAAGGMAWGKEAESVVDNALLKINDSVIGVDIYAGGVTYKGEAGKASVTNGTELSIVNSEVRNIFGCNASIYQNGDGTPWQYDINSNVTVNTDLSLSDVTANTVDLPKGTLTLAGTNNVKNVTIGAEVTDIIIASKALDNGASLTGDDTGKLTVEGEKTTKLTITGITTGTYNIASKYEGLEEQTKKLSFDQKDELVNAEATFKDGIYQVVVTAKSGSDIADNLDVSENTGNFVENIITGGNDEATEFLDKLMDTNVSAEVRNDTLNAVQKMGEAGGNSATAASIVKNVTGVTNDRLSFNCGHSAPHKGGHGVGLFEEGSGADIWVEYVHGKDEVKDMPSTAGASSYEGQYNGLVMGVDFKKVGKFQSGIAFNYGEGDTNSVGSAVRTHSDYDFWGVGYYGNIHNDDSNIIFDINYAQTESDVTQSSGAGTLEANPETTTWSAGVKLEKLYQNENVQIVPYTGLRYMSIDSDDYATKGGGFMYNMERQNIWMLPVGVSIRQEIQNDNGWTVSPRVDLSYIWAFGDTNSNMEVKVGNGITPIGYDVMDDGSFLGLVGIEAHKGQWGYGIAYSYQKGDHSESKKWYVDVNYSF